MELTSLVNAYGIGDLCYSILPCLLQFNMFLDVCNTSFLTIQCPRFSRASKIIGWRGRGGGEAR